MSDGAPPRKERLCLTPRGRVADRLAKLFGEQADDDKISDALDETDTPERRGDEDGWFEAARKHVIEQRP